MPFSASIFLHTSIILFNVLYFDNVAAQVTGSTTKAPPVVLVQPNDKWCLGCICQAISDCNTTQPFCDGDVCGVFRITWAYWADGGKQVINNDDPKSAAAYAHCTMDTKCAGSTVSAYLKRYSQDCNNDGVIDCYDYAAIHRLGGFGCTGQLNQQYLDKLKSCEKQVTTVEQFTRSSV